MYEFAKVNGGWWYVCDTLTGLLDYYDKTWNRPGERYFRAAREKSGRNGEEGMRVLAELLSEKSGKTLAEAYAYVSSTVFASQLVALLSGQTLYINEYGGYNFGFRESAIEAVVHEKDLIYPHYTVGDIRISRFAEAESGRHFYAHVGELEVSAGTGQNKIIKWGSYEEAYENALRYCLSRK